MFIRSLYAYDEQGFLIQASEDGSTYQYERDTEGNTLRKSAWGRTLYEAGYDACGRIAILDGTRYKYDKAGRLQRAESDNGISATYRYYKNGMQREVVCGNGLRTTYEYDSRNQLTSLAAGFDGKEPLLQAVAIANGHPDILTIDRGGAKNNRKASLKGIDKVPGKDLDEYPPAMFKEGGSGASVKDIHRSDNRGSGSSAGHQLRPYPDGTRVKYKITN